MNKSGMAGIAEIVPRQGSSIALVPDRPVSRGEPESPALRNGNTSLLADSSSSGAIKEIAKESIDLNQPQALTRNNNEVNPLHCSDLTVDRAVVATVLDGCISYPEDRGIPLSSSIKEYWSSQLAGAQVSKFPPNLTTSTSIRLDSHYSRPFQISDRRITAITTTNILRGAWALVIARHLESNDVVFGSTISRPGVHIPRRSNDERPTVATVPLRIKIDKKDLNTEFLRKIQKITEDMIPYEQTGLQNIASFGATTLEACHFHNHLIIELTEEICSTEGADSAYRRLSILPNIGQYCNNCPLVMQCVIGSQGSIEVYCHFDTRAIVLQQVHTIYNLFEHIVSQLSTHEKVQISEIDLCSPHDLRQILQWNGRKTSEKVSTCVQDLISDQVRQRPEHEAIHAFDGQLTYAELDELSSRLALHLIVLGVRPEMMVATCFEKSKWAVVAMLAVMKAGGAFMPLDPAHPTSRHRALLERVGAEILITSPEATPSCAETLSHTVVLTDDFILRLSEFGGGKEATLAARCSPNNAAYVMFTSGSTGEPKGMIVEQAALCSSIMGHGRAYGLVPESRVLQFSSFTFDSSLSEILTPLVFGSTVCMPSDTQRLQNSAKYIRDAEVDVAILTPSFASTLKPDEVTVLKTLVLSGEVISKDQLKTWCGRVKLINAYGPSEVCVDCTTHVFQSPDDSPTNIGFAHSGTCWIVEPENHHQLAPIGCVGELLVQGPALARGYFGDKEKTKASFLDNVEWQRDSEEAKDRLYKTGDLVKYNHDGSIEYIGRKDTQVKLRGQRIELGEIEHNVRNALPSVEHVVVELVEQGSHQMLIAFFAFASVQCSESQGQPNSSGPNGDLALLPIDKAMRATLTKLTGDLKVVLPTYMLPNQFLPLKNVPFLPSMKIDRKRLRAWAGGLSAEQLATLSSAQHEMIAPTTQTEVRLRDLWAQTLNLKVEAIGKNDTFLRLGGDSISAIQLVSRARQRGINLTVASILKNGSLSQIAAIADSADNVNEAIQESPLAPFSLLPASHIDNTLRQAREQCGLTSDQVIEDAYPCTSMQKGLMELAIRRPTSSIVRYVYKLAEQADLPRFKRAWNQTVLHCANLRTRIVFVDGNSLQVVIRGEFQWDSDIKGADLESAVGHADGFSMGYGSQLCRFALVHGVDGHTYFIWTMHYTILDPWSGDLMRQKLYSAYYGTLGPKIQPHNRLLKYIADLDNDRCVSYWTGQLQGAKQTMLPRPDLRYKSTKGEVLDGQFVRLVTKAIHFPYSSASSITRATVLRAAWALALAKYCSTDDVCFGTSISGRNAPIPGLDEMVGLLPTVVPVRVRVDHGQAVDSYLHDIQTQASEMAPFEQYGLQNISNISAEAHAACKFASMVIIQPAQLLNSAADSDSIMVSVGEGLNGYYNYPLVKGYFMYPLVVQVLVYEDRVEFDAVYDTDIVAEEQVVALSDHFKNAVYHLHSPKETTLINDFFADQAQGFKTSKRQLSTPGVESPVLMKRMRI